MLWSHVTHHALSYISKVTDINKKNDCYNVCRQKQYACIPLYYIVPVTSAFNPFNLVPLQTGLGQDTGLEHIHALLVYKINQFKPSYTYCYPSTLWCDLYLLFLKNEYSGGGPTLILRVKQVTETSTLPLYDNINIWHYYHIWLSAFSFSWLLAFLDWIKCIFW